MLVTERADAGMDALGGGTLKVLGGCLGADGSVIVVPSNGRFALGDEVQGGGGNVLEHSSPYGITYLDAGVFAAGPKKRQEVSTS